MVIECVRGYCKERQSHRHMSCAPVTAAAATIREFNIERRAMTVGAQ